MTLDFFSQFPIPRGANWIESETVIKGEKVKIKLAGDLGPLLRLHETNYTGKMPPCDLYASYLHKFIFSVRSVTGIKTFISPDAKNWKLIVDSPLGVIGNFKAFAIKRNHIFVDSKMIISGFNEDNPKEMFTGNVEIINPEYPVIIIENKDHKSYGMYNGRVNWLLKPRDTIDPDVFENKELLSGILSPKK